MNEILDNRLIVVRGLPGSGKSTLAKQIAKEYNCSHYENDMYFMQGDKYVFDQNKAKDAADWCFNSCMKDLKAGKRVVVSNVFVSAKSVNRYVDAAKNLGVNVCVLRKTSQYKNIHDVPNEVFNSMKKFFCNYSGEILVK